MRKFKTEILVRNNRLRDMQEAGLTVNYKILNDEEYLIELKKKIIEESNEVSDAEDFGELKEELADVMEVIEHIMETQNISMSEINEIKAAKREKIGGFNEKIKTFYVEMEDDSEEVSYYLNKPHKYPEI